MPAISQALSAAVELHQSGQFPAAERAYRQVLAMDPNQPDALHLLGVLSFQMGKHDVAVNYLRRAIRGKDNEPAFHMNLGNVFKAIGKADEAIQCYRKALQRKPDYAEAHNNLGTVLMAQGKHDEAIARFQKALALRADYPAAHNNLGVAFKELDRLGEAVSAFRRALELQPDDPEVCNNLAAALNAQGLPDEATACCRRALELRPDYAEAHFNLGNACQEQGNPDEAVACYRRAVEHKQDFPEAMNNLGSALAELGQLDEALACHARAVELKPSYAMAHSNLLYTRMFCAGFDAAAHYEAHRHWDELHAAPLAKLIPRHDNDRSPERRLRVGYVSPNFRYHPVGRFLLPLLEAHDRQGFEIFCYSSVNVADAMTERCRAAADVWRDVRGLSDERAAQAIRADGIDILVDLSMHMGENRLLVFARKPAPVQVTYLAYCGTTGLKSIDYRLSDPYLDPPGGNDQYYSERTVRLPESYWCYRPPIGTPPVNALPARAAGHVTFGSLNNLGKVSPDTFAAWMRLLGAVPGSRLLLHARAGSHRDEVISRAAAEGIDAARIEFIDFLPLADYFAAYQRIDIALDPFPYAGGTTTCDALWMGVPVVSLVGHTAVGRGGLSILSNLGLGELAADRLEDYQRIAVSLAQDLPRLSELRANLRERMEKSPLMDAPRFARNVEAAYRDMWRRWVSGDR